jgi:hypothetical protein
MKATKILLGGLVGAIVLFLLGWAVYGGLFADFTATNFNQSAMKPMEEMNWLAMILANLAFGYLLAFVLGWSNEKGWKTGAKVGIVIGLLYSISVDLGMYAMADWYLNFGAVVVDIIVYSVLVTIVGIVVALVMGTKKAVPVD